MPHCPYLLIKSWGGWETIERRMYLSAWYLIWAKMQLASFLLTQLLLPRLALVETQFGDAWISWRSTVS